MIIDSLRWTASAACFFLLLGTRSVLAQPAFVEANATAGITDTGETFGTAWADLNSDGFPDIFLGKHQYTPTVIYINQGDGTFLESIEDFDEPWGVLGLFEGRTDTHGLGSADFDNDGDVDLLEITGAGWPFLFWDDDGLGHLTNRFAQRGFAYPIDYCSRGQPCYPIGGRAPSWFDYDQDGDLDVMVAARLSNIYRQPTAIFRQDVAANGTRTFNFDGSTGVTYASQDSCVYGILAELSGDDTLDMVCGEENQIANIWDTTGLPFVDLMPQMGSAVSSLWLSDLAVGDFNGDLRTDFFAPRGHVANNVAEMVGPAAVKNTVHVQFDAAPPAQGGVSFLAQGDLVVDFDWATQVDEVFIGAAGTNPPRSADLSVYNGWNNHVQLRLSPNDPANQGLAAGTAGGTYIGRVNGRWQVRFVAPPQFVGFPRVALRAAVSVSDLRSEGLITIGQPASRQPSLLLQDAAHQLVDASGQISGPPSAHASAAPGDFDNDGDLDVYVVSTGEVKNLDNILYENDGLGNFTAITGAALGDARGDIYGRGDAVLTADYDLDGRLDLFVTNGNFPRPFSYSGRHQLFRNVTANGNHWVEIDLQGVTSNRDGIGARVFASTPDGKVQLREQGNGVHRHTQNHQRLHIGLGPNQRVDIEVRWPSGVVDEFANLGADKLYALVEGTGGGGGGVSGCGAPTYDPAVDGGLYLWEESCGNATRSFAVRAAGGGSASTVTYAGQVDANQAFNLVSPFSLESTDTLVNSGRQVVYEMNVRDRYQDGFGFSIASGANVCFGLNLPAGTPVLVGPNATPVAAPFDLTTYQSCTPPPAADICGAPTYDPATDAGLYLWEENCGGSGHAYRVRASAGGSTTVVTYAGDVTSNQAFVAVAPYSLENTDVLTSTGLRIDYRLNVRQTYQDGFDFSTTAAASVCFGLDLPAGTPVRVGSSALTVAAPFSLPDLGACTL